MLKNVTATLELLLTVKRHVANVCYIVTCLYTFSGGFVCSLAFV